MIDMFNELEGVSDEDPQNYTELNLFDLSDEELAQPTEEIDMVACHFLGL